MSEFFRVKNGILPPPPQFLLQYIFNCEAKTDTFIIYAQKYCFHTFIHYPEGKT